MYFWYCLQFFYFTLNTSQAKIENIYFFYQKFVHFGRKNTSKYCSRIIVVHVHAIVFFFSKVHPVCHNIVNGIKPGRNSKTTDKRAADWSKPVCWGVK